LSKRNVGGEKRRREGGREGGMDCVGSVLEMKLDGFGLAIGFGEGGESWEEERKREKEREEKETRRARFLSFCSPFFSPRSQK